MAHGRCCCGCGCCCCSALPFWIVAVVVAVENRLWGSWTPHSCAVFATRSWSSGRVAMTVRARARMVGMVASEATVSVGWQWASKIPRCQGKGEASASPSSSSHVPLLAFCVLSSSFVRLTESPVDIITYCTRPSRSQLGYFRMLQQIVPADRVRRSGGGDALRW